MIGSRNKQIASLCSQWWMSVVCCLFSVFGFRLCVVCCYVFFATNLPDGRQVHECFFKYLLLHTAYCILLTINYTFIASLPDGRQGRRTKQSHEGNPQWTDCFALLAMTDLKGLAMTEGGFLLPVACFLLCVVRCFLPRTSLPTGRYTNVFLNTFYCILQTAYC
jgi:hypothetical protein